MTIISVKTTYLSMLAPPLPASRPAPRDGLLLLPCRPGVAWYRFLYNEVGRDLMWVDLNFKSDQELAHDLLDPAMTVNVLCYMLKAFQRAITNDLPKLTAVSGWPILV